MSKESDLLEKAKRQFKEASEAEASQRKREVEDLRFQVPEYQWTDEAIQQRRGTISDNIPTPARPILSIPKLQQPLEQVLNQERAAHLGVNVHPLSPDADEDVAEVIQGLYRSIERDSNAGIARSWAYDRAVKAGKGWYRVNHVFDEDGPDKWDQVIRIERILYQNQVRMDPAAVKTDFSDANYAFVSAWVPRETFKSEYPKARYSIATDSEFLDEQQAQPAWIQTSGTEGGAILVSEWFYKVHKKVTMVRLADGSGIDEDQLTKEHEVYKNDDYPDGVKRERDDVTLMWCKLTGNEILEGPIEWMGKHIPLIPAIGRELQPFDSERRWVGLIGPAKDAQRMYNFAASTAIEMASLEPKAPWLIAEGQIEGYESFWQSSNVRNLAYLPYKPTSLQDNQVPPPQRVQVSTERMGPAMALLQEADGFIQSATAIFDPGLGKLNQRDRSGRAIQSLQQQGEQANSHFLYNLADVSMMYEAKVVMDLIPKIYDRPGRLVRTMDEEDGTDTVMLNAPYVVNPQGQPQRAPIGPDGKPLPPPPIQAQPGAPPAKIKHYDLTKGVYSVSISIGKSFSSKREQGAEELGQILQSRPEMMAIIGPRYFRFRDFPGSQDLADDLAILRDVQFPMLSQKNKDQAPTPEQAAAQVFQLKQENEGLKKQLQGAAQAIKTDQAKQQATVQKAQMDNAAKVQIAQGNNQTSILIEKIDALARMIDSQRSNTHEAVQNQADRLHEAGMQMMDQQHQADQATQAQAATAQTMLPPYTVSDQTPLGPEEQLSE